MTSTLSILAFLGTPLIAGWIGGGFLARHSASRLLYLIIYIVGAIAFPAGLFLSDQDHRFRLLAATGLFLKLAAMRGWHSKKRKAHSRRIDLWAMPKHPFTRTG